MSKEIKLIQYDGKHGKRLVVSFSIKIFIEEYEYVLRINRFGEHKNDCTIRGEICGCMG